jgi:hypothetical protein
MSSERKKRGRPSSDPKAQFLGVRVNEEQMEFVRRQAKKLGISMGDFVRGLIEEEHRRVGGADGWAEFASKALGLGAGAKRRSHRRGRGG